MKERRITFRLEEFWKARKGKEGLPNSDVVSEKNLGDVFDHCSVIKIKSIGNGTHLAYEHLGAKFFGFYGVSLSKKGYASYRALHEIFKEELPKIALKSAQDKRCKTQEHESLSKDQRLIVKSRIGAFPFQNDSGEVDTVLIGMRWGAFDAQNIL